MNVCIELKFRILDTELCLIIKNVTRINNVFVE